MSLRKLPYIPLYIQDFMTDEKLCECSAEANGVYIRLMCLMHKSEFYGKILLKQKHKQNGGQILNFASMVVKTMPFSLDEVVRGLTELVNEKVLYIEGDFLIQKRMVKDAEISEKRAVSGRLGAKKLSEIHGNFATAKNAAKYPANSEYENDIENESEEKQNPKLKLIEIFFNDLPNSSEFERICMVLNLSKENLTKYVTPFRQAAELDYPSFKDFCNHFKNWVRKNPITEQPKTNKTNLAGR